MDNFPFIDTSPWNVVWPATWTFLFNETSFVTASLPVSVVSPPTTNLLLRDTSPITVSRWFKERSPWINSRLFIETSEPKYAAPATCNTLFIDTSFNVVLPPITNLWFIETSPMTVSRWFNDTSPITKRRLPIETSDPRYVCPTTCNDLFNDTSLPADKRLLKDTSPVIINCWLKAKLPPIDTRPFIDTSPWNIVWPPTWKFLFKETSLATASFPLIDASLPTNNRLFNDTSPMTVRRWFNDVSPITKRRPPIDTSEPK